MRTNLKLSIDKRRTRKDNTFPIVLRLTHIRKTTSIATGFYVTEKGWDEKNSKIRTSYSSYDNITRINNLLLKELKHGLDTIAKLNEKGELGTLSITEVRKKIEGKASGDSFFTYTQLLIDEFLQKQKIGNARSYKNVLREIKKYRNEIDFSFNELSFQFLMDFEKYYLSKGLSENGLAVYMRTIRAIFNRAIKDNIIDKSYYPFDKYIIKTKPTRKRAISYDAIKKIVELELDSKDQLFLTRNIFLMSFYMMGAPFIDLAFLKVGSIVDGRIKYTRKKTGRIYDIKISEPLQELLNFYTEGKTKTEFILPIVKRENLIEQYKDMQWAQNRYNKKLKKLATIAGIKENLTSYVSRHSFASIANHNKVPLTAISQMLGHSSIKTTQVYMTSFNDVIIDEFNEFIIGGGSK